MDLTINSENESIRFSGSFSISELASIVDLLQDYIPLIAEWNQISLNLKDINSTDSSFIQLIFSLIKTFPKKIRLKSVSPTVSKLLKMHGFKIK